MYRPKEGVPEIETPILFVRKRGNLLLIGHYNQYGFFVRDQDFYACYDKDEISEWCYLDTNLASSQIDLYKACNIRPTTNHLLLFKVKQQDTYYTGYYDQPQKVFLTGCANDCIKIFNEDLIDVWGYLV